MKFHIRWMIRKDMPQVLDIENKSFPYPWTEQNFITCLRQRNCIGMVAEDDKKVAGFMIYELHRKRLHLLNLAVCPTYRRNGAGTAMINKLISKLSDDRRDRIALEVVETNLEAQLFLKKMGFVATTTLRKFYEDIDSDAYHFQYRYRNPDAPIKIPQNRISKYLAGGDVSHIDIL